MGRPRWPSGMPPQGIPSHRVARITDPEPRDSRDRILGNFSKDAYISGLSPPGRAPTQTFSQMEPGAHGSFPPSIGYEAESSRAS